MKTVSKYLPLKKFHIVEINSLTPEAIKLSAKRAKIDREDIPHTTLLNAIVHSLGFKGGFAEYEKHFKSRLIPFMEKHGLKKQADLTSPRKEGYGILPSAITSQKLSERIFCSGWKMPEKVFTGYNFDFRNTIEADYYIKVDGYKVDGYNAHPSGLIINNYHLSQKEITNNINLAKKTPNQLISIENRFSIANRRLIDVVVGSFNHSYTCTFHLMGDALVKPVRYESEVKLYKKSQEEKECYKLMFSIFRQRIEESEEGWVDILPFNDNLVFLRGQNGEYDFIFKNQRDKLFEHKAFDGAIKIADIPSFIQDYHFARWEYFEYQGWREKDEYEAENLFYNSGGKAENYPGSDVFRKTYYEKNHQYAARKNSKSNRLYENFVHTFVENKHLAISNLISIEEFYEFAKERPDYMAERKGDSLKPDNSEENTSLPVTLTWYDAVVYAKWFQEKTGLPVRLLSCSEYTAMRENFRESVAINGQEERWKEDHNDVIFFNNKGIPFEDHPPYVSDFDSMICKFNPDIKTIVLDNKLNFYLSTYFAEWLLEKTCIRTGKLTSFGGIGCNLIRFAPPLDCTGKYKHTKIGFRLCYELDS